MKTALVLAALLLSTVAHAGDLRDYSDRSYDCDKDEITSEMTEMMAQNILGPKMIYVKDITELSRDKNKLRCRITVVHSRGKQVGIFTYHNEDGHALVGFKTGTK